ncbi:hypothetical protein LMA_06046, partial [Liquorilactobacillus mali KCTC 3596 = DSM 20444]
MWLFKIKLALNRLGIIVGVKRIFRLMQEMKIHSLKHRRFKKTSIHTDYLQHPNLIKNKPKASTWWADITYLELQPGTWLYLSSVYEPK